MEDCFVQQLVQGNSLLGEQVVFCPLAIFAQFEADLDAPVALGLGTLRFGWTSFALGTPIETTLAQVAILGSVRAGFAVGQGVVGRAGKLVFVRVVG